jgi:FtsH-binding integral membrane protein
VNEPKKSTLAKTQLGWQLEKTELSQAPWAAGQQPYAHLLEPARGSAPGQHHDVQVQPDYVQQANAQQQQVQQYTEDPYNALAAHYGEQPRTNANVAPRRAKGSTPPPATRNLKSTSQPLFNDPTKPHSYNMAAHVGEYDQPTAHYHAQAYHAYDQPPAAQPVVAPDYALYAEHARQADHAAQYVQHAQQPQQAAYTQQQQQDYAAYAQQLQAYAAQQEAYAQQAALAQQQQQTYAAQAQYAQQQGYVQAQQGYAQPHDPSQQGYVQPHDPHAQQYYDAASYQQAQYQQAQHDYAAQYQQQVAAYEQKQREEQQQQDNSLGGLAAKLSKKAEKQKAKLASAMKGGEAAREGKIAGAVATADGDARRDFVKKTYKTLFVAILVFGGLLWSFMNIPPLRALLEPFVSFALGGRWNWGVVLAAFVGASIIAERFTHTKSRKAQYFGLGLYVLAESIIFVPLLAIVEWKTASIVANGGGEPNIVRDAAIMTLAVFGMLTASVVFSKKDFSFLRSALFVASGAAMALIVLSLMFGFNLGLVFSGAMVLLAGGYILYHTSQVLAHHHPEAHVAAALELFSSIALMFWYMIRIFMRARD